MTQDEKREWLLSLTEWDIWGLSLKKQWSKEQRERVLKWHRSKQTDLYTVGKNMGMFKDD